jgi:L-alanine-DL-glutamate epimerase-like enolase superfamily enzyme
MMKITKVEAIPLDVQKGRTFVTSRGSWGNTVTVIRITTDEGIVGIGDGGHAMPIHYYESQGTIMDLVHNWFGPMLLGEDPFSIEKITHQMDRLVGRNSIAKTGIDYALYDIKGKALGVPVYELLGGRTREKVDLAYALPALKDVSNTSEVEACVKEAADAIAAGYKYMKVKVALGDPDDDVERVRLIREAIGPHVPMHVDANQGWSPDVAIRAIHKLEKHDLYAVESPVPDWDLEGLAKVHRSVGVPIIADEAARSPQEAINVIRADAADMFVLHLSKVGGLFKSQEFVAVAEAANMPVQLGIMLTGGIEHAANAHLAVAMDWLGRIPQLCIGPLLVFGGFDTLKIERERMDCVKGYARIKDGFLYPPDGPGLGVELDEERVTQWLSPGHHILTCENR